MTLGLSLRRVVKQQKQSPYLKREKTEPENYRPASLLLVISNIIGNNAQPTNRAPGKV